MKRILIGTTLFSIGLLAITKLRSKENSPAARAEEAGNRLDELTGLLRQDLDAVEDPKAQALFETSAEVLSGLRRAFTHYRKESEAAWE